ncbi:MAG: hypothetical protein HQK55_19080, partial [Deltaproteobacteria bacterium]|nr:hypothetical protein [Deltaproteobacteria bacterium]
AAIAGMITAAVASGDKDSVADCIAKLRLVKDEGKSCADWARQKFFLALDELKSSNLLELANLQGEARLLEGLRDGFKESK